MKRSKNLSKIIDETLFYLKGILFKNKDAISGEELVEYGIVSEDTKKSLYNLKKLRKLNNIYYIWDYNKILKNLFFLINIMEKLLFQSLYPN